MDAREKNAECGAVILNESSEKNDKNTCNLTRNLLLFIGNSHGVRTLSMWPAALTDGLAEGLRPPED